MEVNLPPNFFALIKERNAKVAYICTRKYPEFPSFRNAKTFEETSQSKLFSLSKLSITNVASNKTAASSTYSEGMRKRFNDAKELETSLLQLPEEELDRRYKEQLEKAAEEEKEKFEQEEKQRFYNLPIASADFIYWAKKADWRIDEAIALCFGKSPEIVTRQSLKNLANGSRLLADFEKIRDLADRAIKWQQLFEPVLPSLYLKWAKTIDLPVPKELEQAVEKYSKQWPDWKRIYETTNENYELLKKQHEQYVKTAEGTVKRLSDARASDIKQAAELAGAKAKQLLDQQAQAFETERRALMAELESTIAQQVSRDPGISHPTAEEGTAKRKAPDAFIAELCVLLGEIGRRAGVAGLPFSVAEMPGTKDDFFAIAMKFHKVLEVSEATFKTYIKGICQFKPGARSGDFYAKLFPEYVK